jgi:hypothetical protein
MQKEYTGSIRDPENKNAEHDLYWEYCVLTLWAAGIKIYTFICV